eukprot:scaffold246305_cov19-Prasinocladus_malaysianus.AAC.1
MRHSSHRVLDSVRSVGEATCPYTACKDVKETYVNNDDGAAGLRRGIHCICSTEDAQAMLRTLS